MQVCRCGERILRCPKCNRWLDYQVPPYAVGMGKRRCLACGRVFSPKRVGHVYCSTKCRSRGHWRERAERRLLAGQCPGCGVQMPEGSTDRHCEMCRTPKPTRKEIMASIQDYLTALKAQPLPRVVEVNPEERAAARAQALERALRDRRWKHLVEQRYYKVATHYYARRVSLLAARWRGSS